MKIPRVCAGGFRIEELLENLDVFESVGGIENQFSGAENGLVFESLFLRPPEEQSFDQMGKVLHKALLLSCGKI